MQQVVAYLGDSGRDAGLNLPTRLLVSITPILEPNYRIKHRASIEGDRDVYICWGRGFFRYYQKEQIISRREDDDLPQGRYQRPR